MSVTTIFDGIIIGGSGGAIGGLTVYLVQTIHKSIKEKTESKRVFNWLIENTSDEDGKKFRSTRAISSYTNLTEDRVRYICSTHEKIYLSTGKNEDRWSIHTRKTDIVAGAW
ncbi:hypothetical protein [Vibrio bathopelagicus]